MIGSILKIRQLALIYLASAALALAAFSLMVIAVIFCLPPKKIPAIKPRNICEIFDR